MSIVNQMLREELRQMELYQVQPVTGEKLDANESPFSMSQQLRREIADWIMQEEDLRVYPDTDCIALREALAAKYGLQKENILCAVGSDQIIDYLNKAFLSTGERILVPAPSFSMYALSAQICHGEAYAYDLAEDYAYPVERILELCRKLHPKILYICTPNNPTGNTVPEEDLRRLIENAGCIVVLDEAYGEFSGENHTAWLERYPQLVILKTFSKAYGLAGIRTGYCLGGTDMIEALDRVRAPYNLSTISQVIAIKALNRPEYKEEIHRICEERERIYRALAPHNGRKGFRIYPSKANFFLIKMDRKDTAERLKEKGLLVRAYGGKMDSYIRVSVGNPAQNDAVIRELSALIQEDVK